MEQDIGQRPVIFRPVLLPVEAHERLKRYAFRSDEKLKAVALQAINDFLKRKEKAR
jgi:hypothetical protein